MSDSIVCAGCGEVFLERDLVATTSAETTERCRKCGHVHRAFTAIDDKETLLQDTVGEVEACCEHVAGLSMELDTDHVNKMPGDYCWFIKAGWLSWTCVARCNSHHPTVVEIRITSKDKGDLVAENPAGIKRICAENGLQPVGSSKSSDSGDNDGII